MMSVATAIARQEGFYVHNSRAARNNNPGNLEYGPFAISQGATASDGRFAIFPAPRIGFNALEALLGLPEYSNLTLGEAIGKFAPASENDTDNYIRNVCAWCDCSACDRVGELLERDA